MRKQGRYTYREFISKDPMHITEIDETDANVSKISQMSQKDIRKQAKINAEKFGTVDSGGTLRIHVSDIGKDIVVGTKGLEHGLRRNYSRNWLVALNAGEIIKNSIQLNELVPEDPNAKSSYVLIGAAKNQNEEMYIVRSVIDTYSSELNYIEIYEQDVLHAIANKSEQKNKNQLGNSPSGVSANIASPVTGSKISIARLLDYVNQFYPELLPKDVLKHYGYKIRPSGEMSNDVLKEISDFMDKAVTARSSNDSITVSLATQWDNKSINRLGAQWKGKYTGSERNISGKYIRHILNQHGNAFIEALRGQLYMDKDAIKIALSNLKDGKGPIVDGTASRRGNPTITTEIPINGYTIYVEEPMDGLSGTELEGRTAYMMPTSTTALIQAQRSANIPQRRSGLVNSVDNSGRIVNGFLADSAKNIQDYLLLT